MAMRKAARAPSGCIKTRDLPGSRPGLRSAWPLYCLLPCLLPMLVAVGATSFRLLAEIPEIFLVAAAT